MRLKRPSIASGTGDVPAKMRERLELQRAAFDQAELAAAELVFAGFSLPFCEPRKFDAVWAKVRAALRPRGAVAVSLFGVRDSRADTPEMTFFDTTGARALFDRLEIELFKEVEWDGPTAKHDMRHNHEFKVIARKPRGA